MSAASNASITLQNGLDMVHTWDVKRHVSAVSVTLTFEFQFVPSISGVRKIHKSAGSGSFFATGVYDLYVCCVPSCHSP